MPFIRTTTNKEITKEQELNIKAKFGEAISVLGKSENWLMLEFSPQTHMYFKGGEEDCVYIDIKLYGKASADQYNQMTNLVSNIVSNELNVPVSNIYVSYIEIENWGWNGNNF